MWNFLSCKIKTILFWHCQNEARWLDFSVLSNVFGEQNTQLNQGEYAGSLFFLSNSFARLLLYSAAFIP